MTRYFYEAGALERETEIHDEDGNVSTGWLRIDGYLLFDRLRGHVDDRSLAFCVDEADAEKIVAALNATVRNGG